MAFYLMLACWLRLADTGVLDDIGGLAGWRARVLYWRECWSVLACCTGENAGACSRAGLLECVVAGAEVLA